jgi:hypothetical protein
MVKQFRRIYFFKVNLSYTTKLERQNFQAKPGQIKLPSLLLLGPVDVMVVSMLIFLDGSLEASPTFRPARDVAAVELSVPEVEGSNGFRRM